MHKLRNTPLVWRTGVLPATWRSFLYCACTFRVTLPCGGGVRQCALVWLVAIAGDGLRCPGCYRRAFVPIAADAC